MAAKSSGTIQTVAALISYGLLDDSGSGDARKFKVTDLGFKVLEDNRPGAREAALKEAALKPRLIADYVERWAEGRPSDAICVSELRIEGGFTEDGAKLFLRVFDDAIAYAGVVETGKKTDAASNVAGTMNASPADKKIEVGDLVLWETDGALRLEKPTAVRAFQELEGQTWVFIEGSETGIRMEELMIEQKAPAARAPAPVMPIAPTNRQEPQQEAAGLDVDRFTVDEGVVRIEFPKGMGSASVDELDEFFKLFIKKAKRRAAATN
jgi:hypothetical protein